MIRYINTFQRGLDSDTTDYVLDNASLRDALNIELSSDGDYSAIVTMRGGLRKVRLCSGHPDKFCLLGSTRSPAQVYNGKSYSERTGIVFFIWDSDNGSQIKYYDICDNYVTTVYSDDATHQLGFDCDTCVNPIAFNQGGCNYVYFTDGVNDPGKIEIKIDEYIPQGCGEDERKGTQELRGVSCLRNSCVNEVLEYDGQDEKGGLVAGSYSFFHRYYNSETCQFSSISKILGPIPVAPLLSNVNGLNPLFYGGLVGQTTKKRIKLKFKEGKTSEGFDQIQLFVIRNTDGSSEKQQSAVILDPVDFAECIYYSGVGGQTIDLADLLIDDAAVQSIGDWAVADNKLFGIDYKLNNFEVPDLKLESAKIIMHDVGLPVSAYTREEDVLNYKGYMGDELYPFGVHIWDSKGNGIVCPLDMSNVEENQSDSWAFKFPKRVGQYGKFAENGRLQAMGLEICVSGLPEWACGFEIVRGKRIKNICGQTVHIPTMGVKGVSTPYRWEGTLSPDIGPQFNIPFEDYDGTLDYIIPKVHTYGAVRNIDCRQVVDDDGNPTDWGYIPEWHVADDNGEDGHELSSAIFAPVPEFVYNNDGEAIDWNGQAFQVSICEAVKLKYNNCVCESDFKIFINSVYVNYKMASIFEACTKDSYVDIDKDIQRTYRVEAVHPILKETPNQLLQNRPFSELGDIDFYGNMNQLTQQQLGAEPIMASHLNCVDFTATLQRGLVIELEKGIIDFSLCMKDDACPELYDDSLFETYVDFDDAEGVFNIKELIKPGDEKRNEDNDYEFGIETGFFPLEDGDEKIGAFILNIEKCLGDDRYGSLDNPNVEWIRTGQCGELCKTDDYTRIQCFEVYGGDIFLGKHSFKIHDTTPKIEHLQALPQLLGDVNDPGTNFGGATVTKVGQYHTNVEIISVVLESTVNPNYEYLNAQYPLLNDKKLQTYRKCREYQYNPGYSRENDDKPLVTKKELCKANESQEFGVIYSDTNVRGSVSNPFLDTEGFNRFRANNYFVLDSRYGKANSIKSLTGKDIHIVQDEKIAFLPVGVAEIQTTDGNLLAVGTGAALGSGDFYLSPDVGSTHPETIKCWDGKMFGFDSRRCVLWVTGYRGQDFRLLSWDRMKSFFEKFSDSKAAAKDYRAYMDLKCGKYYLQHKNETIIWNERLRFWESRLDCKVDHGTCVTEGLYEVTDGILSESGEGEYKAGQFTIINNYGTNIRKVMHSVEINAKGTIDAVEIENCEGDRRSGKVKAKKKNGMWYASLFRDAGRKIKGNAFRITIYISGETKVFSVNSFFEKVY